MCGIVGEFRFDNNKVNHDLLKEKVTSIKHRGPDGDGVWFNDFCGLGHVRLSIIDLSSNGAQPMISNAENILSFNGEIYNFKKIKETLKYNENYKSTSDTEVLLNLLDEKGTSDLNDLRGMFAFAYYNTKKEELILVRDQLGIKPLYYHINNNRIVFGSEIKTILVDKEYEKGVNKLALKEHILLGFSLKEHTIFSGINRLEPGSILRITKQGVTKEKYFDMVNYVNHLEEEKLDINKGIEKSVNLHCVSDVKLGMMLSGGIDSNLLIDYLNSTNNLDDKFIAYNAGLEQDMLNISTDENLYSERSIAKMISDKYNIKLREIDVLPESFINLKDFVEINEEPICNPSGFLINEICSKANKSSNKVLFSGHGGDEIFAGYRRHVAAKFLADFKFLKYFFNIFGNRKNISDFWYRIFYTNKSKENKYFGLSAIGMKFIKKEEVLLNNFINDDDIILIKNRFNEPIKKSNLSSLKNTMVLEFFGYLANQNLINMDKFSMKNSIEVRVPFLNLEVIKLGFSKKDSQLIKNYKNKALLRKLAKKKLPKEVFNQKKAGFGPSLNKLLYSDEVKNLLFGGKTKKRGLYDVEKIERQINTEKLSQQSIMQFLNLAIIEQWFRTYID